MYVASTNGELWRVNPREGRGVADATFVGMVRDDRIGFYPTDIAFNDDGSLYGVDGFDLFCIDPANGAAVGIGGSQFDPPWQTALTGRVFSLGQLYGAGEDQLLTIAVGSGKGTPTSSAFGPLSCGNETGDLVFDPDSERLFGTVDCVGGGLGDRSHLVTVDPATGKVLTTIGAISDASGQLRYGVFGLAHGEDGGLYAGTEGTLFKLDPVTARTLEEYTIQSVTPGKSFDRVDGMASRICEPNRPSPRRLTAGQWRQECRDGLDPALVAWVEPIVTYVTDGAMTDVCDALHHLNARGVVDGEGSKSVLIGKVEAMSDAGRRGSRTDTFAAKSAGKARDANDSGMENLCALGLRELTAAALNVGSGRVNAACPHCDEGPNGRYLMELKEMLHDAIPADDTATCNLVKREAHHIVADTCEGDVEPPVDQTPGDGDDDAAGGRGNGNGRGGRT
jgi:hypothetical protein